MAGNGSEGGGGQGKRPVDFAASWASQSADSVQRAPETTPSFYGDVLGNRGLNAVLRGEPYNGFGDVVRGDLNQATSPIGVGMGGFMGAGNQERLEHLARAKRLGESGVVGPNTGESMQPTIPPNLGESVDPGLPYDCTGINHEMLAEMGLDPVNIFTEYFCKGRMDEPAVASPSVPPRAKASPEPEAAEEEAFKPKTSKEQEALSDEGKADYNRNVREIGREFAVKKVLNREANGRELTDDDLEMLEKYFPGGRDSPAFQDQVASIHQEQAAELEREAEATRQRRLEEQERREELRDQQGDLSDDEREELGSLDETHDRRATEDELLDELEDLEAWEEDGLSPGERDRLDRLRELRDQMEEE